jgi:hypothetical protein
MVLPRRVEDDSDDAHSIPFRDNFTADRACHAAGPVAVRRSRKLRGCAMMMAAAVMGTIALCAGGHAVVSPSAEQAFQSISGNVNSIKNLRANIRSARSAPAGDPGPQVPIHKTTTMRKED